MRVVFGVLVAVLLVAGAPRGARAQVNPPGATLGTVPPDLYVPLRDAFLATLRANSPTDASFAYASALQKAQAGDVLGAQREAGQAILLSPGLPPSVLQPLKSALAQPMSAPPNSATLPVPMTIAPGPGVPQKTPQDDPASALAFARSEIDLAELRVGHPIEPARADYVAATAAFERSDAPGTLAAARKASDEALNAYLGR
jgi:hypothetical protein